MKKNFQIKKIIVPPEFKGLRLDVFLHRRGLTKSRSQALKLTAQNCVLVNHSPCSKAARCLKAGDMVQVFLPREKEEALSFYDFPLKIFFEDEHIIVVKKPAGLVVHPAPGHKDKTLINILAHKTKLSPGSHPLRPGVVHRLDKDVSGLLLLAKTKASQDQLIQLFKNHQIRREYWAISLQTPSSPKGTVKSWIARHPVHRKKFISLTTFRPGAKPAISSYRLFQRHNSGLCWIKLRLQTGRTHQIRVHLSALSCPLAGDEVYGGGGKLSFIRDSNLKEQVKNLNRIALHAHSLSFLHPFSGQPMTFRSSWPADLKPLLKTLGLYKTS